MSKQKIKKSNEFRLIYLKGKKIFGKFIVIYFLPKDQTENRLGIIVKKSIGNAVFRNKVKRILREIWWKKANQYISGCDVIIIARVNIKEASFNEIESEIRDLLQR